MQQKNTGIRFDNLPEFCSENQFQEVIIREIEQLDQELLPLQEGLALGSHVTDDPLKAMMINCDEEQGCIKVKVGVFYSSIIAGCSCADDPTPIDTNQEYCVLEFEINKETGEANVTLLPES